MFGFLLQWPTILTLLMFPVLIYMYLRLVRYEEKVMREAFGQATPAFVPRLGKQTGL
jgi:protein-S-isoprenylcysteine O-methyltransferase Ste14